MAEITQQKERIYWGNPLFLVETGFINFFSHCVSFEKEWCSNPGTISRPLAFLGMRWSHSMLYYCLCIVDTAGTWFFLNLLCSFRVLYECLQASHDHIIISTIISCHRKCIGWKRPSSIFIPPVNYGRLPGYSAKPYSCLLLAETIVYSLINFTFKKRACLSGKLDFLCQECLISL